MAVSFASWKSTRTAGAASSTTHTLAATPADGDTILLCVWRSNGATTGSQDVATSTGWTLVEHYDPPNTYRMIGTVLKKVSDGTSEGTITIDWVDNDPEGSNVVSSVIVSDVDHASIATTYTEATGTVWTYAADSLDANIHAGATRTSTDISSTMYPSGDTNTTHSAIGFRNGGISQSGGTTSSGTHSVGQAGANVTISMSNVATARTSPQIMMIS